MEWHETCLRPSCAVSISHTAWRHAQTVSALDTVASTPCNKLSTSISLSAGVSSSREVMHRGPRPRHGGTWPMGAKSRVGAYDGGAFQRNHNITQIVRQQPQQKTRNLPTPAGRTWPKTVESKVTGSQREHTLHMKLPFLNGARGRGLLISTSRRQARKVGLGHRKAPMLPEGDGGQAGSRKNTPCEDMYRAWRARDATCMEKCHSDNV